MRTQVMERLSFGDESECIRRADNDFAVVHACKIPCHRSAVGYTNNLPSNHPHYLAFESGNHLYLNLIDPETPMFMLPSFTAFMAFVDRQIVERPVLIHCNQGQSRAPSLTLLYMAKRGHLPAESYDAAAAAFREKYPYLPGKGIVTWLRANWAMIV